jgi:hypothetical protein
MTTHDFSWAIFAARRLRPKKSGPDQRAPVITPATSDSDL